MGRFLYGALSDYATSGWLTSGQKYKSRVTPEKVQFALAAIEELCPLGWSYDTKKSILTGEKTTRLKRSDDKQTMLEGYRAIANAKGEKPLGQHTFYSLLDEVTSSTKMKRGISYFVAHVKHNLKCLDDIVERVFELATEENLPDSIDIGELRAVAKAARIATGCFYKHAQTGTSSSCDGDSSHCTRFAFKMCPNTHTLKCADCAPAFYGPATVQQGIEVLMNALVKRDPHLTYKAGAVEDTYNELIEHKRHTECGQC